MRTTLTPKQVARALGVSESSVKRWCDDGALAFAKTEGGHRRIAISDVLEYVRATGQVMPAPEALGLPASSGNQGLALRRAVADLQAALVAGDEPRARAIVFDLFLSGHSLAAIFDEVVAPVFHAVGDLWQCGEIAVYEEHRACLVATHVLDELRRAISKACTPRRKALGGTLEGDPYALPTAMIELVLRDRGWAAQSLGSSLPVATLVAAIEKERPDLVWISVSSAASPVEILGLLEAIEGACSARGAKLVVGGRALPAGTAKRLPHAIVCMDMGGLCKL